MKAYKDLSIDELQKIKEELKSIFYHQLYIFTDRMKIQIIQLFLQNQF